MKQLIFSILFPVVAGLPAIAESNALPQPEVTKSGGLVAKSARGPQRSYTLEPKGARVVQRGTLKRQTSDGSTITEHIIAGAVQFEQDQSEPKKTGDNDSIVAEIKSVIADTLKSSPGAVFRIEGHASIEGGVDYNKTLSDKRAAAILELVAAGYKAEQFKSVGFGSSFAKTRDPAADEALLEQDRRVFVIREK